MSPNSVTFFCAIIPISGNRHRRGLIILQAIPRYQFGNFHARYIVARAVIASRNSDPPSENLTNTALPTARQSAIQITLLKPY